mmetsp:Transcript_41440/g.76534  ORF Transcript_41440/g.76534 Transcript_41440/m.76534 type:complete len:472 (+) Transcript_41440:910-2325(+)
MAVLAHDHDVHVPHGLAARTRPPVVGNIKRDDRTRLRQSVPLADRYAHVVHELDDFSGTCRSARVRVSHPSSEPAPDLVQDDAVQRLVLDRFEQAQGCARAVGRFELAPSQCQSLLHQLLLQRTRSLHGVLNAVVHSLVQRRYREQYRRLDQLQVLQDLGHSSPDAHASAVRHGAVQFARLAVAVGPRQERQRAVGLADEVVNVVGHAPYRHDVRHLIRVHHLDALGTAGRSGGVDESGQVVGGRFYNTGSGCRVGRPVHGRGERVLLPQLSVQAERRLHTGRAGQNLPVHPLVYILRGAEQHGALGIVQDVRPILGQLGFVHGHDGRVEGVGGRVDARPFPAVVGYYSHLGVFGNAQILQHRPTNLDLVAELLVRHPLEFSSLLSFLIFFVGPEQIVRSERHGGVPLHLVERLELEQVVGVEYAPLSHAGEPIGRHLRSYGGGRERRHRPRRRAKVEGAVDGRRRRQGRR